MERMNSSVMGLYFFKKIDCLKKNPKADQAGDQEEENIHIICFLKLQKIETASLASQTGCRKRL